MSQSQQSNEQSLKNPDTNEQDLVRTDASAIPTFLNKLWDAIDSGNRELEEVRFFSADGKPLIDPTAAEGKVFSCKILKPGQVEVQSFNGRAECLNGNFSEKCVLERTVEGHRVTLKESYFDSTGSMAATVNTSVENDNKLEIETSIKGERRVIGYENGRFTSLVMEAPSAEGIAQRVRFVLDEKGNVKDVVATDKDSGKDVSLEPARKARLLSAAKDVLDQVAAQFGLVTPSQTNTAPLRSTEFLSVEDIMSRLKGTLNPLRLVLPGEQNTAPARKLQKEIAPEAQSATSEQIALPTESKTNGERTVDGITTDAQGRITKAELPGGGWRNFDYDEKGQVIAVRESNRTICFSQDGGTSFSVQGVEPPVRAQLSVNKDGSFAFKAADGFTLTFMLDGELQGQDAEGQIVSRAFADGRSLTYKDGNLSESIDAAGKRFQFGYAEYGLASIVKPDGTTFVSKDGQQWRQVTKDGASVEVAGRFQVSKTEGLAFFRSDDSYIVDGMDGSTIERDKNGRVLRVIDSLGQSREITRDDKGTVESIRFPDGKIIKREGENVRLDVDGNGNIYISVEDKKDNKNSVYKVIHPDGWTSVADKSGVRKEKVGLDGSLLQTTKDGGRIISMTTARQVQCDFEYDEEGRVKRFTHGREAWFRDSGDLWIKEVGGSVTAKLKVEVSADGTLRKTELETGKITTVKPNGSEITVDGAGRVLSSTDASGRNRSYGYDPQGKLVEYTDERPLKWTLEADDKWVAIRSDGGKLRGSYKREVLPDGSFIETDLKRKSRLLATPDGREVKVDDKGRVVYESKTKDTSTTWNYDDAGKVTRLDRRMGNGLHFSFNDKSEIVYMKSEHYHSNRAFEYDNKGEIKVVHEEDGETWRRGDDDTWTKDGSDVKVTGKRWITADGTYGYTDTKKGLTTLHALNGDVTTISTRPVFSRLTLDKDARVKETIDLNQNKKQYFYDEEGRLNRFVQTDAQGKAVDWGKKTDGTWRTRDGQIMKGSVIVASDGTLTREYLDTGRSLIEKLGEASIEIDPADIRAKAKAINAAIYPNQEAIQVLEHPTKNEPLDFFLTTVVPFAFGAPNPGMLARGHAEIAKDWEAVETILLNMSEAEKVKLKTEYMTLYGKQLEDDFKFYGESQVERVKNALNKKDGVLIDTPGKIHACLTERKQFLFGRSDETCEQDIRDAISQMSSVQIKELCDEYTRRYNQDLKAILLEGELSDVTKKALKIQLEGTDVIAKNPDLTLQLADLAISRRDPHLLAEAFRSASPEARQQFKDKNGEARLKAAFGGNMLNWLLYVSPASLVFAGMFNLNTNVSDTDYRHVTDYVEYGKLSAATQIKDNTTWLGDSEKGIELALHDLTDKERQNYQIGRMMARGEDDATVSARFKDFEKYSAEQKAECRAFYDKLSQAMRTAAGAWYSAQSRETEFAKWEDMVCVKGGSLLSKLANHNGSFYNSSDQEIFATVENIGKTDWNYLKQLPEAERKEKLAEIEKTLSAFMGRAVACSELSGPALQLMDMSGAVDGKAMAKRCVKLLTEKLECESYEKSQSVGRRTLLESLKHNTNFFGNNYNVLAEAIVRMTPAERAAYYNPDSADYRAEVDALIAKAIPKGTARDLITGLLASGSKDKSPVFDPLDKLNLRILEDDKQRQDANLVGLAISSSTPITAPMALSRLATDDDTTQKGARAAGLITDYPAEAVRDLAAIFQDKEAYSAFKKKYDSDANYKANFDTAARKLFPKESSFNKYMLPLIKDGHLPPEVLVSMRESLIFKDNAGYQKDFAAMSAEDRAKLMGDGSAQQTAFAQLNPRERQVSESILKQGKARPEDVARACVIDFGTTKEQVIEAWTGLSPEDRNKAIVAYSQKYGSCITTDLRAKIGADTAEDLLDRPGSPEEALDRMLSRYYKSYDGIGGWLVDKCWDGSGYQARDGANQLVAMRAQYTAQLEKMADSPEFRDAVKNLAEKLKNFKESKEEMASAVVDAIIAVAAVAGAYFTGGTSLTLLMFTAVAGAALKVAVKASIMGADYDWRGTGPLMDALTGAFDAATSFIGPGEIAIMCRIGSKAAVVAAEKTVQQVGKAALREGAEKTLKEGATQAMRHALATGAKDVSEEALTKIARQVVKDGADDAAVKQVVAALRANLKEQIEVETKSVLKQMLREYALEMAAGSGGAGLSAGMQGMAQWDPNLSAGENFKRAATTIGTSTLIGGGSAGVFQTTFKAGGAVWSHFKPEAPKVKGPGAQPGADVPTAPKSDAPAAKDGSATKTKPDALDVGTDDTSGEGTSAKVRPEIAETPTPQPGDATKVGEPGAASTAPPRVLDDVAQKESNRYSVDHRVQSELPDGFTNGGAGRYVSKDGTTQAPRAAVYADKATDPVLRDTVAAARAHMKKFEHLSPAEQLAELTRFVQGKFRPDEMTAIAPGMAPGKVYDAAYIKFMVDNKGTSVPLGKMIGMKLGGCAEQTMLLKILAHDLKLPVGTEITMVRGNGTNAGNSINHAWIEVKLPGEKEARIYDARQGVFGEPASSLKERYKPGSEMPKELQKGIDPAAAKDVKVGDSVTVEGDSGWKLKSELPDGTVVLAHDAVRTIPNADRAAFLDANPHLKEKSPDLTKPVKLDGQDGWKIVGIDKETGAYVLYKQDAVQVTVTRSHVQRAIPEQAAGPADVLTNRFSDGLSKTKIPADVQSELAASFNELARSGKHIAADIQKHGETLRKIAASPEVLAALAGPDGAAIRAHLMDLAKNPELLTKQADLPARLTSIKKILDANLADADIPLRVEALLNPNFSLADLHKIEVLVSNYKNVDSIKHLSATQKDALKEQLATRLDHLADNGASLNPEQAARFSRSTNDVNFVADRIRTHDGSTPQKTLHPTAVNASLDLLKLSWNTFDTNMGRVPIPIGYARLLNSSTKPEAAGLYRDLIQTQAEIRGPGGNLGNFKTEAAYLADIQSRVNSRGYIAGFEYEWYMSFKVAETLNAGPFAGANRVYVASGHNSAADGAGIDGYIIDLDKGQITPLDFANSLGALEGKIAKQPPRASNWDKKNEAMWATHIRPNTAAHPNNVADDLTAFLNGTQLKGAYDHLNSRGAGLDYSATNPGLNFAPGAAQATPPSLNISDFSTTQGHPGVAGKPPLLSFHPTASDAVSRTPARWNGEKPPNRTTAEEVKASIKEIDTEINRRRASNPADPHLKYLEYLRKRMNNELPQRTYENQLAQRLQTTMTDAAAVKGTVGEKQFNNITAGTDAHGKYLEYDITLTVSGNWPDSGKNAFTSQITSVRVYENGHVIGQASRPGRSGDPPIISEIELGHISKLGKSQPAVPGPRMDFATVNIGGTKVPLDLSNPAHKAAFFEQNPLLAHLAEARTDLVPLDAAQKSGFGAKVATKVKGVNAADITEAQAVQIHRAMNVGNLKLSVEEGYAIVRAAELSGDTLNLDRAGALALLADATAIEKASKGTITKAQAIEIATLAALHTTVSGRATQLTPDQINRLVPHAKAYRAANPTATPQQMFDHLKTKAESETNKDDSWYDIWDRL